MLKLKDLKVNYTSKILENKIRLDVYERENAPIEIRFNILGGDVFSNNLNKKGLAHFVEHILCAGTQEYPTKDKLALYLDSFGGYFGGETWSDRLVLKMGCPSGDDVETLIQVLSSCLQSPVLNEKVMESERGSIISEFNQKYSKYQQKVYKIFYDLLFFGTEYRYSGIGSLESINDITSIDIQNWLKDNLIGGRIGICVTGDISSQRILDLCEKFLNFIPSGAQRKVNVPVAKENLLIENFNQQKHTSFLSVNENNSLVILGFRVGSLFSKNYAIHLLLNQIFGAQGRRSKLLTTKLRYEKGLSYSPLSYFMNFIDTGYFCIELNCKSDGINNVLEVINKIIREDFEKELTKERFELEKNRFNKTIASTYEKNSEFLEFGNYVTLTESNINFDKFVEEINNIRYEDFLEEGRNFLRNRNWYISYSSDKEISLIEIQK